MSKNNKKKDKRGGGNSRTHGRGGGNSGRGGGNFKVSNVNRVADGGNQTRSSMFLVGSNKKLLDVEEVVKDFEVSKAIVEQFQMYLKDEKTLEALAKKAKFSNPFIEQIENLLISVGLRAAGKSLHKTIRAWKTAYDDDEPLADFYAVGIGLTNAWSHVMLEYGLDVQMTKTDAEGLEYLPTDDQLISTNTVGCQLLDEKMAKKFKMDKQRLRARNCERPTKIMADRWPSYEKVLTKNKAALKRSAMSILADSDESDEELEENSEEIGAESAKLVMTHGRACFLTGVNENFGEWSMKEKKILKRFTEGLIHDSSSMVLATIPDEEDYDQGNEGFCTWIGTLIDNSADTCELTVEELELYIQDKRTYIAENMSDRNYMMISISYINWCRISLGRSLMAENKLFLPENEVVFMQQELGGGAGVRSRTRTSTLSSQSKANKTFERDRSSTGFLKVEKIHKEAQEKIENEGMHNVTRTLAIGIASNNLKGTPQVPFGSPAYQYMNHLQSYFARVGQLNEANAPDVSDYAYPHGVKTIIALITYDWWLARLLDKIISLMEPVLKERIYGLMRSASAGWIDSKISWSVMSLTLGLPSHSVIRILALFESGEEENVEEILRDYVSFTVEFDNFY